VFLIIKEALNFQYIFEMKIKIEIDASIDRSKLVYRFRTGYEIVDHVLFLLYSQLLVSLSTACLFYSRQILNGVNSWHMLIFFGTLFFGVLTFVKFF
jgi:hypothetical protein